MPSDAVQRARSSLIDPFADPEMAKGIRARSYASPPAESKLPSEVREAADTLEQVLDPVELDPRSDVYALAGTIYSLRTYPAAVAKLLRAAVAKEPKDRPSPLEFGREFVAAL